MFFEALQSDVKKLYPTDAYSESSQTRTFESNIERFP